MLLYPLAKFWTVAFVVTLLSIEREVKGQNSTTSSSSSVSSTGASSSSTTSSVVGGGSPGVSVQISTVTVISTVVEIVLVTTLPTTRTTSTSSRRPSTVTHYVVPTDPLIPSGTRRSSNKPMSGVPFLRHLLFPLSTLSMMMGVGDDQRNTLYNAIGTSLGFGVMTGLVFVSSTLY
ncbi:hypothetical protein FRC19_007217 [Serendipita sp. 401]|nr:hypothetical protein FRC15_005640 [Serendipita sp. 397]KAG8770369.1 hypothetical protein FRC16_006372 [Serendipita sp. 398]KAG8806519.1 hypothetical protein FRC19_007217 [Serendipita sp. 401]KAG8813774.1 hypothetical protein FRC18_002301 [Serendipita sp. 400]KAG8840306.1 hypothetical protein FRC20_005648 [Serendipita sp. 405]KAG9021660.1 hypothetical protein FS842_006515 [Serendipita sp. 407]